MKKLVSVIATSSLLISFVPTAFAADSVLVAAASDPAIEYVRSRNILKDTADGTFHPEQAISKADFTVAIVDHFYPGSGLDSCYMNIAPKLPPRFTRLFSDVPTSAWYAKHVCLGMFLGLVNGNSNGSFQPLKGVTNAEAATMVAKTYGLVYPPLRTTRLQWFETPMWVLRQQGALPMRVDPAATITRGQLANMFYALRNQRRFPAERTLARQPATQPAPAQVESAAPAPTITIGVPDGSTSLDFFFRTAPAELQPSEPVEWIDAETAARTRRAPKISRRQLLMQME